MPKKYTCSACKDTHLVDDSRYDQQIMCTRCPSPCEKCRGGNGRSPYCKTTPCYCPCHAPKPVFDMTPPSKSSDFEAGAMWALALLKKELGAAQDEAEALGRHCGSNNDLRGVLSATANLISGLKIRLDTKFISEIRKRNKR